MAATFTAAALDSFLFRLEDIGVEGILEAGDLDDWPPELRYDAVQAAFALAALRIAAREWAEANGHEVSL